ncbi:MAG TPA: transglycosylase SLT domain-containing protein [Frankiaceae bacterium]|nr:transglycosylase SLT domain-containing protein [Frankiaceae bacterium]
MRLRLTVAVSLVLSGFLALPSQAACAGGGARGTDPGMAAINAEIDRAAARRQVPPYVLKAIAWHESRWRQFYSDGRVVVSGMCALGVMQVLASGGFDADRLATDYRYNIDAGAQVLAAKMSASSANVPSSLGADDRRVGENWYRAVYRYIGSGYYAMTYADKVFASIVTPPSETRPWVVPVAVANPRNVVRGYSPQSGHSYVARTDGTWVSTLGRFTHAVTRADWLAGASRMSAGRALEGDQIASAVFYARNLGWQTWGSRVSLSTYPVGRGSRLYHPSWRTSSRPNILSATTPTGAVGKFTFAVKARNPSSTVETYERFVPVVDGATSLGGRASSTWTLHPAKAPTARITSAPEYVTDASTDRTAVVGMSFADPSPGSGVAYAQISRLAPGATSWSTPAKVSSTRLSFSGAGAHQVKVRAVDRAGHVGAWTTPRRIVVPRDDTDVSLSFSGTWSSDSVAGSWLGSVASASEGASVTLPVTGTSYALIGTRGPDLAPLTVYLDGVLVAVVDTYAETTAQRRVLYEGTMSAGEHVLRVVVGDDTLARKAFEGPSATAYLDAIAVS